MTVTYAVFTVHRDEQGNTCPSYEAGGITSLAAARRVLADLQSATVEACWLEVEEL